MMKERGARNSFASARCRLLEGDARINDCVKDVGEQLAKERKDAEHERQSHDGVVVALTDCFEIEPPHTGPAENLFENHCAAKEAGQRQAQQCNQRDERVTKSVTPYNLQRRHTFGAGSADVVLANDLFHVRLHEAAVISEAAICKTSDRKDRVL